MFRVWWVFAYDFVTNFQLSLTVKELWKSANIWWSYGQELGVLFFWLTVYKCTTTCTTNRNDGNTSAKYLTTESFMVVMLLTFIISIPRPSLFHSTFKIFLFVYLSHRSLPFLVQDWLHEFPGEIRELRDFVHPHLEKWGYNFFFYMKGTSKQLTISIEYTVICCLVVALINMS